MPDYGSILRFLAANPPQRPDELKVHASLLELLALSLRAGDTLGAGQSPPRPEERTRHLLAAHLADAMGRH